MSRPPPRQCAAPGCPELAHPNDKYCPVHRVEVHRGHRPGGSAPFYDDSYWKLARTQVLTRDRRCRYCGRRATEVHRLIPKSQAPHLAVALKNLVGICRTCHARKHEPEEARRAEKKAREAERLGDPSPGEG